MKKKHLGQRKWMWSIFFLLLVCWISMGTVSSVQAKTKWKKVKKSVLAHTWGNADYFTYDTITGGKPYSSAYTTTFKKNGKVVQKGYRNLDKGTYKISKNKKKVVATYNKCYFDFPGSGYTRLKGYKYTVTYRLKNSTTLYAKYSKNATETNAGTGYWYR